METAQDATTGRRRAAGTGSLTQRRHGAWLIRSTARRDPVTGRQVSVGRVVHGSRSQAEKALGDLNRQTGVTTHDSLNHLIGSYLRLLEQRGRAVSTLRTYRLYHRRHLAATVGEVPLAALTARHLDRLYGQLAAKGLAPATIRQIHAVISGALAQAVKWDVAAGNVAAKASPPTIPARELAPPTPEQVRRLIAAADEEMAVFVAFAAVSGARRGELARLQWEQVDLGAGTARIHGSKTDTYRTVALDAGTVGLLAEHRTRQTAGGRFVFSDRDSPPDPARFTERFAQLRTRCGLPHVRLHDLRHFCASYLVAAGQDPRTVANRLGHSNPAMTLTVYSHGVGGRDRDAAETIAAVLHGDRDGG